MPTTIKQPLNESNNIVREPEIVAKHAPLVNGGLPNSQQETMTTITATRTVTSTTVTTRPVSTEAVSISSTPPVSSTGVEERIPLNDPVCLTEEDPQIRCSVCNSTDCMVHNPRHWYCIDCGQRLLGPHTCSNETEHLDPTRTQDPTMTDGIHSMGPENYNPEILLPWHYETNMRPIEDRVSGNNPLINRDPISRQIPSSSVPFKTFCNDLPTYEEAVTPDQDLTTRTKIVPNV